MAGLRAALECSRSVGDVVVVSEVHPLRSHSISAQCVLSAACHAACPVNGTDPEYLGPAALAKLFRFHIDPRNPRDGYRLDLADDPHGWWACRFYSNCQKVCPKGVPPNVAIAQARRELKGSKDGGKNEG